MRPTVSVVMPVYHVEQYVADAICSVLDQSFQDFELLIVDDGGDDASMDICRLFTDPRIRIITQKNRGLAGARNTGIRHARGKYVALIDSDDLWRPRKLALHVAHLETQDAVGVSYAASMLVDDAGAPIGVIQSPKLFDVRAEDVFLRNPVGNGSAPVIRRETLDAIVFKNDEGEDCWFDESFRQSEDIECWMRIALTTAWTFEGVDGVLTHYRVNEGGLSANIMRQFESWKRMCAKVEAVNPGFHKKWARLSEAFQLRYLARRAARMRCGGAALQLSLRALFCDLQLALREPKKTLSTLAAACALCALPRPAYERLEQLVLSQLAAAGEGAPA